MGNRRWLLLIAAVLAVAGCGSSRSTPQVQQSQVTGQRAAASPSPSVAPVYRTTAPAVVGERKKNSGNALADIHARDLAYAVRTVYEDVIDEAPAYGAYGAEKDGNLMMFAAALIKQPTREQVGAILRGLVGDLEIAAVAPGSHGEGRTCGNATIEGKPAALCTWRDERSIGVAVFPGQRPATVRDDFASLQGLAFIASSVS